VVESVGTFRLSGGDRSKDSVKVESGSSAEGSRNRKIPRALLQEISYLILNYEIAMDAKRGSHTPVRCICV
jgi:hypothetical protein